MQFSPSPAAVREQLERVIHSDQVGRSKRLRRFLKFTIEKTLDGHEEELTEHEIGTVVYDRGADFDPAIDGIVRAEAHRMRAKLEAYYRHEGRQDPVVIEYPIGSYVPLFQFSRADFLPKTGKVADLIRSVDWSNTVLGPLVVWPRILKHALSLCLRSQCPLVLFWGPDFLTFPNDAAYVLVEATHPHIIGRPSSEGAVDWGRLSPILNAVVEAGESISMKDALWLMDRIGFREELYFTTAFSPVTEDGNVAGVLAVVQETTRAAIDKRRLKTLTELTERSSALLDVTHACRFAASVFEHNPYDIPFACIYLYDDTRHEAIFRASAGVAPGTAVSPPVISDTVNILSPIADASLLRNRQLLKVEGRLGRLPTGAWEVPPQDIAIVPLPEQSPASPAGFIVVGLNPHRLFDRDYRDFLETLASRLSELLVQAQNVEQNEQRTREAAELQRSTNIFVNKASDAMRTSLTILLGLLDEVLESRSLLREQRRKLIMARRNALRISKSTGEVLDYVAGRITRAADPALPVYGEEALHWADEQIDSGHDSAWQERKLVSDRRRRIVVIAGEEDFRRYLQDVLSDVYSVVAVTEVAAAMTLLVDRPDLLILDDLGIGGELPALVQSLRSDPALSLIPIILLSGHGSDEHRFQALASGLDDFLLKSFTTAELMERVRSQIALAEARAAIMSRQIESQLPLSAALDQIPLGIMIADVSSGAITFTNEAMGHMLGDLFHRIERLEDIPEGTAFFQDGTPYSRDQYPLVRAARQGEVITGEIIRYRLADGRNFDVRASSRPVLGINGNVVAAVLVLEKVTELKNVSRRLEARR